LDARRAGRRSVDVYQHVSNGKWWKQMEFEDFVEPEIAVTAAVTAAVFSPRARKVIRKGLVYGMAGALAAGDILASFARSIGQGCQQASAAPAARAGGRQVREEEEAEEETETAKEAATTPSARRKSATRVEGKPL
jgi:hypothetical protein